MTFDQSYALTQSTRDAMIDDLANDRHSKLYDLLECEVEAERYLIDSGKETVGILANIISVVAMNKNGKTTGDVAYKSVVRHIENFIDRESLDWAVNQIGG